MKFPGLKSFLQRWLINTLAVLVAMKLVRGIHCADTVDLLLATLVLGILNTFLRPLLLLLSLPLLVFTLGLFTLVINAGLLWLVSELLTPGFRVNNFKTAFWGALVMSIVSFILNTLTGTGNSRLRIQRGRPPGNRPPDDGQGPVIDV